jgi:hypothetical protein
MTRCRCYYFQSCMVMREHAVSFALRLRHSGQSVHPQTSHTKQAPLIQRHHHNTCQKDVEALLACCSQLFGLQSNPVVQNQDGVWLSPEKGDSAHSAGQTCTGTTEAAYRQDRPEPSEFSAASDMQDRLPDVCILS